MHNSSPNIVQIIVSNGFHEGKDQIYDSLLVGDEDEEKLLDFMEPIMAQGGNVVDHHTCDLFPERWFDLVIVLQCNTECLYDRLVQRGYSQVKVSENMECEITQVVLESAHESYAEEIVVTLPSNSVDDMDSNVSRIAQWYSDWCNNNNYI